MNQTNQINIAVVGAGFWGRKHIRNFYELGLLHTICDIRKELEREYRAKYPDIHFTESFPEVLDNPQINAVVIATPAIHHHQMTKEALLSKRHVLVKGGSIENIRFEDIIELQEAKNIKTKNMNN